MSVSCHTWHVWPIYLSKRGHFDESELRFIVHNGLCMSTMLWYCCPHMIITTCPFSYRLHVRSTTLFILTYKLHNLIAQNALIGWLISTYLRNTEIPVGVWITSFDDYHTTYQLQLDPIFWHTAPYGMWIFSPLFDSFLSHFLTDQQAVQSAIAIG